MRMYSVTLLNRAGDRFFQDCIVAADLIGAYKIASDLGALNSAETVYVGPLLESWRVKLRKTT